MRLTPETLGLLRQPDKPPTRPTARERAAHNREHVLQAVARFGHLRCAELAAACWPGARYGQQMAQRTVRSLVASGDLRPRANALGGVSYVLTRPGAAALELRGIAAHHGLDLASVAGSTYRHHALTARWCLHMDQQGYQAHHEHALASGQAPVTAEQLRERFKKLPDAVLLKGQQLYLCETEAAPKGMAELLRIVALAEHVGRRVHPALPYVLAGVFIVFDARQNHGARIARAARDRWDRYTHAEQTALAARITLARVDLGLPLLWRGCTEERLQLRPV